MERLSFSASKFDFFLGRNKTHPRIGQPQCSFLLGDRNKPLWWKVRDFHVLLPEVLLFSNSLSCLPAFVLQLIPSIIRGWIYLASSLLTWTCEVRLSLSLSWASRIKKKKEWHRFYSITFWPLHLWVWRLRKTGPLPNQKNKLGVSIAIQHYHLKKENKISYLILGNSMQNIITGGGDTAFVPDRKRFKATECTE